MLYGIVTLTTVYSIQRDKDVDLDTAFLSRARHQSQMNWQSFLSWAVSLLVPMHLTAVTWRKGTVQHTRYQCSVVPWVRYTYALAPCDHEEADTRLFLHALHCAQSGHRKVLIRSVQTDVVVLAIAKFHDLSLEELWVAYGTKKHYKLILAHAIADSLGEEKARAFPFFHAFSGCDTLSSFSSIGKKTAWDPGEFSLILHTHLRSYLRWQHQSQRSKSVGLKDSSFFFMTKQVNAHTWMKQGRYFLRKGGR